MLTQQNLIISVLTLELGIGSVEPRKARDWSLEETLAPEEVEELLLQQLNENAGRLGRTEDC